MENSLLIHTCCAPCISHVYDLFAGSHSVTVYFYNPNIAPRSEYEKRLSELKRFALVSGVQLLVGEYNAGEWARRVKPYRFLGERSRRCEECFRSRLDNTFIQAGELGIRNVTTALSISPHKDAMQINRIGKELEKKYGINFIEGDFKKNDGYRKSVALSRVYGFYRQNYCGCIYSKLENDKNPTWLRKIAQSDQRISS